MARLSRQTKEILQIVIFLVVVGLLLTFYVIYPLGHVKTMLARADIDDFKVDSLPAIDTMVYLDAGFTRFDTFRVDINSDIFLRGAYLKPDSSIFSTPLGTIILLPDEDSSQTSLFPLASSLLDSGFQVVLYDQRASGISSGKYHGDGFYEASDLEEVISFLELRNQIVHPLTVAGFSIGGEAALLAAAEESRINKVVAVQPILTTDRYKEFLVNRHGTWWFPFRKSVLWWWYEMRTSYAAPSRSKAQITAADIPTLVFMKADQLNEEEVTILKEQYSGDNLKLEALPSDPGQLMETIVRFIHLKEKKAESDT